MPSSLSIYSAASKTKIIFQFLWGILEGRPNRAWPTQPILKNCHNGTFFPVDKIWNFSEPNDFIWSAMKVQFCDFIQIVSHAPSMFISIWINVNKWNYLKNPHRNSIILFVLGSYEYLKRLEGKIRKCLFFYAKIFWKNSVQCFKEVEL